MLHAVVVGINTYSDPRISPLQAARADAEAVARLFAEGIVNAERTVQILLNAAATRGAIMRAVGEVLPRRQRHDDLIVIYFAGHGSPEQQNPPDRISRYLVPHDADYNHVFATGIGLETELVTLLERQNAGRILLVLDSCFSGKTGGRTFLGPKLAQRIGQYRAPLSLRHLDLGTGRVILVCSFRDMGNTLVPGHG